MIGRWTYFVYVFPSHYVEESRKWRERDIEAWSEDHYFWQQDEYNGLKDFAQKPEKTWRTCRGDCEDYALVAASCLTSSGHNVSICFCGSNLLAEHVFCYDRDTCTIYSSGKIIDSILLEYIADSEYSWVKPRHV